MDLLVTRTTKPPPRQRPGLHSLTAATGRVRRTPSTHGAGTSAMASRTTSSATPDAGSVPFELSDNSTIQLFKGSGDCVHSIEKGRTESSCHFRLRSQFLSLGLVPSFFDRSVF